MSTKEQLLTPDEAASRLSLSVITVRDMLRAGRIPGVKLGRLWRITERTVDEIASGERPLAGWLPKAAKGVQSEAE